MPRSILLPFLLLTAAALPAAEVRDLTVDREHSKIEVAVKATIDSFTGHLADYAAAVQVVPGEARVESLVLRFHFADVRTGDTGRDAKMNAWQQTDQYPDSSFTLAGLAPLGDGRYTATGQLKLHGVAREISFPVVIKLDHGLYSFDGEATVDTRVYGLPLLKLMVWIKVDPLVRVIFHLQGTARP
ncbi:MAG: YceI family protein [Opitutales bacterium]